MADIHGSPGDVTQMPQADTTSGPAPVPYGGPSQQTEPPVYHAELGPVNTDGYVLHGSTGLNTTQDPSAYDVNGGTSGLCTPYYGGAVSPVLVGGDPDAGGRDDMAPDVAGAVANATGRWQEHQADTYKKGPVAGTAVVGSADPQQGSVIGDLVHFPPAALDPGAGVGNTTPTGAFFDPPRGYGGEGGAPGYNQGNQPPAGFQGEAQ